MKEISNIVKLWDKIVSRKVSAALATLVQVSGSHYRKPGARMLFTQDGETAGSISGGCLERDLREHANKVIESGDPVVIQYDTGSEDDLMLGTGMGCGGLVDILIEPTNSSSCSDFLNDLAVCHKTNQTTSVATVWRAAGDINVNLAERVILHDDGFNSVSFSETDLVEEISSELEKILASRTSRNRTIKLPDGEIDLFLESVSPPVSLAVFGAGDDSIPLLTIARQLGWQVTIIDSRKELLTAERFPKAHALRNLYANEIAEPKLESFDAVVIMTHNYNTDLKLLKQLLPSSIRYIGLLGAVKRSEKLLAELREQGTTIKPHTQNKFYTPAGLDIGAEGESEIALSIIAEIKAVLSKRQGGSIRERTRKSNQ